MSCLDATFTLTPKSPIWSPSTNFAYVSCNGADFWAGAYNFEALHTTNQFFFSARGAADPTLDYTQFVNRRKVRSLDLYLDLAGYGPQKQLALIFGFAIRPGWNLPGHVLVYSAAGLLHDQALAVGDNQFLLEIEALDVPLFLYLIHGGGEWLFNGISGYVI